jgi:hypothetical protein
VTLGEIAVLTDFRAHLVCWEVDLAVRRRLVGLFWESSVGLAAVLGTLAVVALAALVYLIGSAQSDESSFVAQGGGPTQPGYQPGVEDIVAGDIVWSDRAVLDSAGLELDDVGPRRREDGDLFTASWDDISARPAAKIALWVEAGIPTAAQCRDTVILFGRDHAPAETGRRYCVTTSNGRFALIKLVQKSPYGPYGWLIQASVWSGA